jgi:hypothetical protein
MTKNMNMNMNMNNGSRFDVLSSRFVFPPAPRLGRTSPKRGLRAKAGGFWVLFTFMFVVPGSGFAEVTKVTITAKTTVADGRSFGSTGPYEKLTGTIEFALNPSDRHNTPVVDLEHAARGSDGKVHFTADLFVLQPVDPVKGNGVLLFEISNRGTKGLLGRFNRARNSDDPTTAEQMGDGFLMREGYTLVWVGWQFDVAAPGLRVEAPAVNVPGRVRVSTIQNEARTDATLNDLPGLYEPVDPNEPSATLTVRNLFRDPPSLLPRNSWRFTSPAANGRPRLVLDSGFEPGRIYEVDFAAKGARVAGVGLAAIRDAASAFRYRSDLPVRGRSAYVFGISQSGRFLRQFLHDGFNTDERDRKAFDLVWPHIAGAGQGSFNERFALPGYSSFPATRFPYADLEQVDAFGHRDGLLTRYQPALQPKVIYTNTPVEYWGQGRAAALTHTTIDGARDLSLPANVRSYLIAGAQHGEAAFPPPPGQGQALGNPTPQGEVMRALLRAAHRWASGATPAPPSSHPTLRDGSLTPAGTLRFPALPGVTDPRVVEGPLPPLPFLVPQVDADGNDIAGIRVPEVAVPLATTTGWNFRAARLGNPTTIVALLGSYIPFARTRAEREATKDPRLSIEERYKGKDDYLDRIRSAALAQVKSGFMLEEDVESTVQRAARHWDWAMTR